MSSRLAVLDRITDTVLKYTPIKKPERRAKIRRRSKHFTQRSSAKYIMLIVST